MRRVVIAGDTNAGKTTFSRALAARMGVPVIELDAVFWGPNWTETPRDEFRARVALLIAADTWVVDGNYSAVRDLVWSRADTLVWLDPPFHVLLRRLFVRTNRRVFGRVELWNGNRERFRHAYFSTDSLYVWLVKAYRKHHREWPHLLAQPEYANLVVHRFRTSREAARWLASVGGR